MSYKILVDLKNSNDVYEIEKMGKEFALLLQNNCNPKNKEFSFNLDGYTSGRERDDAAYIMNSSIEVVELFVSLLKLKGFSAKRA